MKKLIIAALAVAAVAGCQKQGNVVEEQGTPIIVKAGFSVTADTKAINAEGTGFVQGEDVFRIWAYDGVDAPANLYDNIANHKVDMKANNEFHLNEPKFYPVNGNKLYFYAYAPAANTVSQGTGLADATATFTLNGGQDIIYANDVTGYDKTGDAQPDLEFNHKMTCIEFHVIADENFGDGMLLKNISILSQPNQGVMKVVDGDIDFSGSTTYSNAIADVEIEKTEKLVATVYISPEQTSNTFQVQATASETVFPAANVTLVPKDGKTEGVKYKVILTFKAKEIIPTASIVPWVDGEDVNVDIQ